MYIPGKSPTSVGAARCDFCQHPIPFLDFREGRAAVISAKTCCASCADEGAWMRLETSQPPPGVLQRRATPRFIPSVQCSVVLRLPTLIGFLLGNLSLKWLDVSEGGLRTVLRRNCAVDDRLAVRILHQSAKRSYRVCARVRHVQDFSEVAGGFVTGLQFENPPETLREFIRNVHNPAGILGAGNSAVPDERKKRA